MARKVSKLSISLFVYSSLTKELVGLIDHMDITYHMTLGTPNSLEEFQQPGQISVIQLPTHLATGGFRLVLHSSTPVHLVSLSASGLQINAKNEKKQRSWHFYSILRSDEVLPRQLLEYAIAPGSSMRFAHMSLEIFWSLYSIDDKKLVDTMLSLDLASFIKSIQDSPNSFYRESAQRIMLETCRLSVEFTNELLRILLQMLPDAIDNFQNILPIFQALHASHFLPDHPESLPVISQILNQLVHRSYEHRSGPYNFLRSHGKDAFVLSLTSCAGSRGRVLSPSIGGPDYGPAEKRLKDSGQQIYPSRFISSLRNCCSTVGRPDHIVDIRFSDVHLQEEFWAVMAFSSPTLISSFSCQLFPTDFGSEGWLSVSAWNTERS